MRPWSRPWLGPAPDGAKSDVSVDISLLDLSMLMSVAADEHGEE